MSSCCSSSCAAEDVDVVGCPPPPPPPPCTFSTSSSEESACATTTTNQQLSAACVACRFQRRRCPHDCDLAPYFSPSEDAVFEAVHHLFGVKNFARLLNNLPAPHHRHAAALTMKIEAQLRACDPVLGPLRYIHNLELLADFHRQKLFSIWKQLLELKMHNFRQISTDKFETLQEARPVAPAAQMNPSPAAPAVGSHCLLLQGPPQGTGASIGGLIESDSVLIESCQNSHSPAEDLVMAIGDSNCLNESLQAPVTDDNYLSSLLHFANLNFDSVGENILPDSSLNAAQLSTNQSLIEDGSSLLQYNDVSAMSTDCGASDGDFALIGLFEDDDQLASAMEIEKLASILEEEVCNTDPFVLLA